MFCIYCGKQLNEGTTCSCQNPAPAYNPYAAPVGTPAPQPTATYNSASATATKPVTDSKKALHTVFGSGTMKFVAILLTISFCVRIISGFFDIALLLTFIAAWIIYSNSKNANGPATDKGYGMFAGLSVLNMVLYILATPLLVVLIWYYLPHINELISYFTPGYRVILTDLSEVILVVLTILVYAWGIVYNVFAIKNSFHLKKLASGKHTQIKISGFYCVILFLHGLFFVGLSICIFLSSFGISNELPSYITEFFIENSNWAANIDEGLISSGYSIIVRPMVFIVLPTSFLITGVSRMISSIMFSKLKKLGKTDIS